MKRKISQDKIESGDVSNKKAKQCQVPNITRASLRSAIGLKVGYIMNKIVKTPGLQHIIEKIFFNLGFKDLMACQLVNKSIKIILENPMFWLKKWRYNRGLSKENQNNWIKVLQMTKNKDFERRCVEIYIKKVIKIGHFVDVPCYIDNDAMTKATQISFQEALKQKNAGVLQILAPLTRNFNAPRSTARQETPILDASEYGHIDVVKALAPLIENPNSPPDMDGLTPISIAALTSELEVIRFLTPLTKTPNEATVADGETPLHMLAYKGHLDVIKYFAPLTGNPNVHNKSGKTPIYCAALGGHLNVVRYLKSLVENPIVADDYGNTTIHGAVQPHVDI